VFGLARLSRLFGGVFWAYYPRYSVNDYVLFEWMGFITVFSCWSTEGIKVLLIESIVSENVVVKLGRQE